MLPEVGCFAFWAASENTNAAKLPESGHGAETVVCATYKDLFVDAKFNSALLHGRPHEQPDAREHPRERSPGAQIRDAQGTGRRSPLGACTPAGASKTPS